MTFSADLETDRDNVFLNSLEFAETVSYRVASTGATSNVTASAQNDGGGSELLEGTIFRVSADEVVAPVKGDQITWEGRVYTILFILPEVGLWVLDCSTPEEIT